MSRLIEPLTDEERLALIAAARSFLGVPFKHQGRKVKHGIDCVGLVGLSLQAIGKPINDRTNYGRLPYKKQLEAVLRDHFGSPVSGAPQPGDIALFSWEPEASHVGIITPHPDRGIGVIHCYLNCQRVVEHGIDSTWRDRIVAVYRT